MLSPLASVLYRQQPQFHPVLPFDPIMDQLGSIDLSEFTTEIPEDIELDLPEFTNCMQLIRNRKGVRYLIGGYGELRTFYKRSLIFETGEEPRRLHLGTDIWGEAGTPVYAFNGGVVHSVGYNDQAGDYGATLILLHQLEAVSFYTLYGHISIRDIQNVTAGQYLSHGQIIAHIGDPSENGQWPPHLHFQVILDMEGWQGDFPGVCRFSERSKWLANCPDPNPILQLNRYLKAE